MGLSKNTYRRILHALIAVCCAAVDLGFFSMIFQSCLGHPPNNPIGMWMLPLSFVGTVIFSFLAGYFFISVLMESPEIPRAEFKQLPKKVFSFFSAVIAGILTMLLVLFLFLLVDLMPSAGVFFAAATVVTVPIMFWVYQRLSR